MALMTLEQAVQSAFAAHRAGRLREAEFLCRQVLSHQPRQPAALHLLAMLAMGAGAFDDAERMLRQALEVAPGVAALHNDLGTVLQARGRTDEAVACFRRTLQLLPDSPEVFFNLGNALRDGGHLEESIGAFRQALALRPDYFDAHVNLANVLQASGKVDEALASLRTAVSLRRDHPVAQFNLGNALYARRQYEESIAAFRRAVELRPDYLDALVNLGNVLQDSGQLEEAIAVFRRALEVRPDYVGAQMNLANALHKAGRSEEAIAACRRAVAMAPECAEVHYNLGNALQDVGRLDEAMLCLRQALALRPDYRDALVNLANAQHADGRLDDASATCEQLLHLYPDCAEAHWNLGLALLVRGELEAGWKKYEWRWRCRGLQPPRKFAQPQWDGGDLGGRTVLLHAEQGLGDTIQFIRYAPLVAARGGRVIVECRKELVALIAGVDGVERVIAGGEPLPAFDVHCPLLSLPLACGTRTLAHIPAHVPYLHPDPARVEDWRARLGTASEARRVGLVWAGRPDHKNDHNRSTTLQKLAPLFAVSGARFYSLQKGPAAVQAQEAFSQFPLTDCSGDMHDFSDTAALLANLDLLISVDTSTAHLAGAMGVPVWLLLPKVPDWRWLQDRADTPWYPNMRLFRQSERGDWDGLLKQVSGQLATFRPGCSASG